LFNDLWKLLRPEAVNQRIRARGVMLLSRSGSDLRNRRNLRLPLPLLLLLLLIRLVARCQRDGYAGSGPFRYIR
jgi:hypothetical protein